MKNKKSLAQLIQELAKQNKNPLLQMMAMEAEVASEPSIAKAPAKQKKVVKEEKKVDGRTTPKFIAHLRRLAKKRKQEAAERRAAEAKKSSKKAA